MFASVGCEDFEMNEIETLLSYGRYVVVRVGIDGESSLIGDYPDGDVFVPIGCLLVSPEVDKISLYSELSNKTPF